MTQPKDKPATNSIKTESNDTGPSVAQSPPDSDTQPPGILDVFQSVLAAMFGVQSDKKREQDFEHGHVGNYIFVGVVMVMVFIMTIVFIVDSILESAGS